MKKASFLSNVSYLESKPKIDVMLDTEVSKEIRIALDEKQEMKEHQTPFPIMVQVLTGEIDFGVEGEKFRLLAGDVISLDGGVPHDLFALKPSIIRLSLTKSDSVDRVHNIQ
jgi:quercetin dioxygenase-like cupin family protein